MLEGDQVHQVALRGRHAVGEEVDERVKELRSLSVRLVYVREAWEEEGAEVCEDWPPVSFRLLPEGHSALTLTAHLK